MPRPYPREFRQGAIDLARRGDRPIAEVALELGIAESCLRRWLKQGQLDRRERDDALTTAEREELRQLRREVSRLKQEKEILRKAGPSSPGRRSGERVSAHRRGEGKPSGRSHVQGPRRLEVGLVCVVDQSAQRPGAAGCVVAGADPRDPYGQPRRLWVAAYPGGAAPWPRHPGLAQARGAADAIGWDLRAGAQAAWPHDDPGAGLRVADDLVERQFRPAAPNVLWVADITYLRSWEGWLYLVAVQDAYSRRIVGWSMADHMRSDLEVDALNMAIARRRPEAGLIHHSHQGSQFVSLAFGQACGKAGIARSMG
jgi:transposase InsO family protein